LVHQKKNGRYKKAAGKDFKGHYEPDRGVLSDSGAFSLKSGF
jgi:hypothetical protein